MTPIEYIGLALYRLIFLLGLFNLLSGIVGYFNPNLIKALYRKLFRLDFDARIVSDDEADADAPKDVVAHTPDDQRQDHILRVYVAASSREMDRVDRALAGLGDISSNVVVTYRWIDDMRAAMAKGRTDADLTREEAITAGHDCLNGVIDADVCWLLYPNEPTRGAWVELGYARHLLETINFQRTFPHPPLPFHIVVSYEGRTSLGACPLAVSYEENFHEALGDASGLLTIAKLAEERDKREEAQEKR